MIGKKNNQKQDDVNYNTKNGDKINLKSGMTGNNKSIAQDGGKNQFNLETPNNLSYQESFKNQK